MTPSPELVLSTVPFRRTCGFQHQDRRRENPSLERSRVETDICEVLDRVAQAADPEAKVWKGSEVPPNQQGLKILGAPFGHWEYIAAQLERSFQKQETLIQRITLVPALQAAWLILLHCASARANYLFRVVDPSQVLQYTQLHDERMWNCLCHLLGIAPDFRREEHCHFASGSWRAGSEECSQDQGGGVLGELG